MIPKRIGEKLFKDKNLGLSQSDCGRVGVSRCLEFLLDDPPIREDPCHGLAFVWKYS